MQYSLTILGEWSLKGPFSAKHQEIGSNQRHLQTILLYLTSVLSEKSENLYKTFLEPVEPEKQGFRSNWDRQDDEY